MAERQQLGRAENRAGRPQTARTARPSKFSVGAPTSLVML